MKTIFRYTNLAILIAAIFALGAMAAFAQTATPSPCEDPAQGVARDKITELFKDKTLAGRKAYLEAGKAFLERFGACDSAKDMSEYLTPQLPKLEGVIRDMQKKDDIAALTTPFDAALKAKDWDKVYSLGKQILQKYPDDFRTVEIVLGSIGGEEAITKGNFKYADDTLTYGKQSIADLEAGKPFVVGKDTRYGLSLTENKKVVYNFEYPNKEDALGWLNWYVGYITNVVKKDKVGSLPYLYKATQAASDVKAKPAPYALIGYYYAAEGDKLTDEIQALSKAQDPKDTEEVAKQKVDAIKAKVALSNGTNERAIDAFSRAISRIPASDATYKAEIKKVLDFSYNRRFGKMDGLDTWVANVQKQPFVNPSTPVTPITDPEPTTAPSTGTTAAPSATTPSAPVKPAAPTAKPQTTTTKPASAPAATTSKPQAKAKKPVAKKKTT